MSVLNVAWGQMNMITGATRACGNAQWVGTATL